MAQAFAVRAGSKRELWDSNICMERRKEATGSITFLDADPFHFRMGHAATPARPLPLRQTDPCRDEPATPVKAELNQWKS